MNKIRIKQIFIILLLFLFSCEDDKQLDKTYTTMKLSSTLNHVSDYGFSDGAIDITVTGGEAPFQYLWSNNSTAEDIIDLACGEYSVRVSDATNNTISDTFTITQPEAEPIIVEFTVKNPSTTDYADGKITAIVSGGYEPFYYQWSNGETTKDISDIPAALYIITINDSRGQTLTDSVNLSDYVLTDVDGNVYSIVKIGEQIWMKENLRVTHAPDSSEIVSYLYSNNADLEKDYGRLYSWTALMNGSNEEGTQGICPCGWHIPSDEEYKLLEIELGMTRTEADMTNTWRGKNIGTALIIGGSSGFDARLSGRANSPTRFSLMGRMEYYWTSSEYGNNAWRRCLDGNANNVGRWNTFPKSYGFSIRCIKNK